MQLIKGKHAIEEALSAHIPIQEVIISASLSNQSSVRDLLAFIRKRKIPLRTVSPNEFNKEYKLPQDQHIVAFVKEIPVQPIEKLYASPENYPMLLCCDHLQDPYNFGAIIRTAFALGVNGIIFPKDRQVSLTAGVIKASSGSVFHIDLFCVANLGNTLKQLKKEGYWVYGADQDGAQPLQSISFNSPSILIVGNEQKGISPLLKKAVDQPVSIPMQGKLDSLNVSVATGIIVYTMMNQHSTRS